MVYIYILYSKTHSKKNLKFQDNVKYNNSKEKIFTTEIGGLWHTYLVSKQT